MADSQTEVLFKFLTQGQGELDKAAGSAEKLAASSAKASSEAEKLSASMAKVGQSGNGLDGLADKLKASLADPLGTAGQAAEGLAGKMGLAVVSIGAIATAAFAAGKGLFDLVSEQGKLAETTLNMADRLGLSAGQMEKLQAMAGIAGVNIGSLQGAARTLSNALEDVTGTGAKTARALDSMGVATRNMDGSLRGSGAILIDTMDKLSRVEGTAEQTFKALQVLPRSAALELIPLIRQMKDLDATVSQLGYGIEDGLTGKLAKADDAIDTVGKAWERLKRALAGGIVGDVVIKASNIATRTLSGADASPKQAQVFKYGESQQALAEEAAQKSIDIAGFLKSRDKSGSVAQLLMDADAKSRKDAADVYRAMQGTTKDGLKARLQAIDKEIGTLNATLSESIDLNVARPATQAKMNAALAEKANIEAQLKPAKDDKSGESLARQIASVIEKYGEQTLSKYAKFEADLKFKLDELKAKGASDSDLARVRAAADPERQVLARDVLNKASDFRSSQRQFGPGGALTTPILDYDRGTFPDLKQIEAEQKELSKLFLENLKKADEIKAKIREEDGLAAVKLLELAGREIEAAQLLHAIRKQDAKDGAESRQADLDYQVKVAELAKGRLDAAKNTAGKVFDSLLSKNGSLGLGDFLKGQKDILLRQVFVNGTGELFKGVGGIGGNIGKSLGPLGKLFEGTLFDPKNADQPVDKNTTALEKNRAATETLTQAILTGTALPGGGFGGLISDGNGITGQGGILGKIKGASSLGNLFGGASSVLTGGGLFSGLFGGDRSIVTADGKATTASALGLTTTAGRIGNVAGSAAAVGTSALGIFSGLKEGGIGGATKAVGSGLGLAAAVDPEPISKAILSVTAVIAGALSGFLGKSREKFDKEQSEQLERNRFSAPTSITRGVDSFAGGDAATDFNYRGQPRVTVIRPITVTINALDARSIEERGFDISQAVARQVDAGMPISESINRAVFGAGVA